MSKPNTVTSVRIKIKQTEGLIFIDAQRGKSVNYKPECMTSDSGLALAKVGELLGISGTYGEEIAAEYEALQARCYEAFPSGTDGIFDALGDALKQRDELLAALESIASITYDAGFNIGGPLEHCPGNLDHDEANRLLSLACEYLKDTSKAASRAIASVKGGAKSVESKSCGKCNHDSSCAESGRHKNCMIGNELRLFEPVKGGSA